MGNNNMKLNPDNPLNKISEDLLDRNNFSIMFGELIENYSLTESLVIGLIGEWGDGKSSIINMAIDNIFEKNDNAPFIIVRFNPWNFTTNENLVSNFFSELISRIRKENNVSKNLVNFLRKYSLQIVCDVLIPDKYFKVKKYGKLLLYHLGFLDYLEEKYLYEPDDDSIENIKNQLNHELINLRKKIVVIIDDMDRLEGREIRQIFSLVKSVADFSNVIYIMSFDLKMINNALKDSSEYYSENFVDKIVQIPINIPKVSNNGMEKILSTFFLDFAKLHNIYTTPDVKESLSYLKMFFSNVRDIKRYFNILNFKIPLIKEEIHIPDFLIITAIEIFEYNIFNEIKNSKTLFTGVYDFVSPEKKDNDKNLIGDLLKTKKLEKKDIINVIGYIFPKIKSIYSYSNMGYGHETIKYWRKNRRICDSDSFDIYFEFNIGEDDISQVIIKDIIDSSDNVELFKQKLLNLDKENKTSILLDKLEDSAKDFPKKNISNVVDVLMDVGDCLYETNETFFDTSMKILRVTNRLLERLENQEDRYTILCHAIFNARNSLYTIIEDISVQDQEHGKYGFAERPNSSEEDRLLNGNQLENLEKLAYSKIKKWADNGKLLGSKRLPDTLYSWIMWGGKKDVDIFINNSINKKEGLFNLLYAFTPDKNVHSPKGFYLLEKDKNVNIDFLKNILDIEVIEKRVSDELDNKKDLNEKEIEFFALFLKDLERYSSID